MPITYGTYKSAYAVIIPCADTGVFSFCIRCFFIYWTSEYIIGTLYLSAVAVYMEGKVAFFIILERFFIAELVNAFAYFAKTVIMVFNCISVAVDCFAYLSGGGIFIAFFYAVGEARCGDSSPSVCMVRYFFMVSVNNSYDLPSCVVFILLECSFCFLSYDVSAADFF